MHRSWACTQHINRQDNRASETALKKEMTIGQDEKFGMLCYGTEFKGIGGIIKKVPEDFVVAEVLKHEAQRLIDENSGRYPLFVLSKRKADTLEAKAIFERLTGLSVNILGLKDRYAITKSSGTFFIIPPIPLNS